MSEGAPRVSIVTGASAGIGAAIARALVALGWPLAVGARRSERLEKVGAELRSSGVPVVVHPLDAADPASIDAFFEEAERELGPVEVLVNNAGLCHPGLLHEVPAQELASFSARILVRRSSASSASKWLSVTVSSKGVPWITSG